MSTVKFNKEEQELILSARKWGENQSYEACRAKFAETLKLLKGEKPIEYQIMYAIGINLNLDYSDIVEYIARAWHVSEDTVKYYIV